MVQWLRLHLPKEKLKKISPPNPGGVGPITGWGAKIPHVLWPKKKKQTKPKNIKQEQYCNKFNKYFFKNVHIKKKILKKESSI